MAQSRPRQDRRETRDADERRDRRSSQARAADHAAIGRLVDELLPALAAKLGATGLGEIEVAEGDWRLRVRRPASDGASQNRRAADRSSRSQPGHVGHGHARAAVEGHKAARPVAAPHSTNGNSVDSPVSARSDGADGGRRRGDPDPHRAIARSPAVGVFHPKSGMRAGTRVHAGDRLGVVDMLGVPQDVVSPGEGIVGQSLVEAGDAVEYGQELIVIELMTPTAGASSGAAGD